jgi:hypothetical protein
MFDALRYDLFPKIDASVYIDPKKSSLIRRSIIALYLTNIVFYLTFIF